uniref:Major facilitator superfamily (MFS) profile domain-containing protein n=1 Tax=Bracon brevicornis TaxID=1563983 RepID=A0A6V7J058_9HYME
MTYIMMIMDAANLSANTHLASIIFASSQIIGCWLSTVTVDRFGRRPLLLIAISKI